MYIISIIFYGDVMEDLEDTKLLKNNIREFVYVEQIMR